MIYKNRQKISVIRKQEKAYLKVGESFEIKHQGTFSVKSDSTYHIP
jgi:hypothetical protein